MRHWLLTFFCCLTITVIAFGQNLTFTPLPSLKCELPPLPIGQYGAHTFLFKRAADRSLALTVLNDSGQSLSTKPWVEVVGERQVFVPQFLSQGVSAAFVAQCRDSNTLNAMVITWDGQGNARPAQTVRLDAWNPNRSRALNLFEVTHAGDTYHLFYKCRTTIGVDSLSFKGILLDSAWQRVKEVSIKVPYDKEAQLFADALVDEQGAIYLLFCDQPFNFRLSTHISLYTCRRPETGFRLRDMLVKDHKLKDLQVTADAASNRLRVKALYMDKNSKNVDGIAIGTITLDESVAVSAAYYPFDAGFRKAMRKSLSLTTLSAALNEITLLDTQEDTAGTSVYAQLSPFQGLISYRSSSYSQRVTTNPFNDGWRENGLTNRDYTGMGNTYWVGGPGMFSTGSSLQPRLTGLFALRLDTANSQRFQQWKSLPKDRGNLNNAVLPFQKGDSSAIITYVSSSTENSKLVSSTFTAAGVSSGTTIKLARGMRLQLASAIRLSLVAYLVPYIDSQNGIAGLGRLEWR